MTKPGQQTHVPSYMQKYTQMSGTAKPVTVFDADAATDIEMPRDDNRPQMTQKSVSVNASTRLTVARLGSDGVGRSDVSTQVFTRDQAQRYQGMLNFDGCEVAGCLNRADAGTCNYRICCSKGCQRNMCASHIVEADAEIEDDAFHRDNRVCRECETRANRAFWLAVFLIIGVPILAALPAILLYGSEEVL